MLSYLPCFFIILVNILQQSLGNIDMEGWHILTLKYQFQAHNQLDRSGACHVSIFSLFSLAGQIHQRRILQSPLWKTYIRLPACWRRALGQYLNFHLILLFLMHVASPGNKPPVSCWGGGRSPSCNDLERALNCFFSSLPTTALCSAVFQLCSANQDSFHCSLSTAQESAFLGLLSVTTRFFFF